MPTEFTTPVGRIVWGHPCKPRNKTDNQTKQPVFRDGKQVQQWTFGVAFDKATFQSAIWPYMHAEAATAFTQGTPPKFSWKITDGDSVDAEGKPYNQREGYAGCMVLAVSTETNAPPIFKFNNGKYDQLPPEAIKCGDYVSVGILAKVNVPTDRTHTPGLYINPLAVELVGYGTEIVSQGSADPMALFKGQQHQLPAGASAMPMGGAGAVGMPGMGQPMQQPGMMPQGQPMMQPPMQPPMQQPAHMPAQQPGMMPAPAPDFAAGTPGMMPQGQPMMQQPGMMPQGQPGMPGFMPPR